MLIALYFLFTMVRELPVTILAWLQVILIVLMPIVVTLAGIMLVCSAAGVRISQNMGSTILKGIFDAIGYIGKKIINAIGWLIRQIVRAIPKVFHGSRKTFTQMGMSKGKSTLFAVLVTTLVII